MRRSDDLIANLEYAQSLMRDYSQCIRKIKECKYVPIWEKLPELPTRPRLLSAAEASLDSDIMSDFAPMLADFAPMLAFSSQTERTIESMAREELEYYIAGLVYKELEQKWSGALYKSNHSGYFKMRFHEREAERFKAQLDALNRSFDWRSRIFGSNRFNLPLEGRYSWTIATPSTSQSGAAEPRFVLSIDADLLQEQCDRYIALKTKKAKERNEKNLAEYRERYAEIEKRRKDYRDHNEKAERSNQETRRIVSEQVDEMHRIYETYLSSVDPWYPRDYCSLEAVGAFIRIARNLSSIDLDGCIDRYEEELRHRETMQAFGVMGNKIDRLTNEVALTRQAVMSMEMKLDYIRGSIMGIESSARESVKLSSMQLHQAEEAFQLQQAGNILLCDIANVQWINTFLMNR